jgi:hypothetical protein
MLLISGFVTGGDHTFYTEGYYITTCAMGGDRPFSTVPRSVPAQGHFHLLTIKRKFNVINPTLFHQDQFSLHTILPKFSHMFANVFTQSTYKCHLPQT